MISIISVLLLQSLEPSSFEIHGHRGARASRPENSLSAFEFALENGADVLEMDIVATSDDVLVVNHDLVVNQDLCLSEDKKHLYGKVWIRDLNYQELQQFDCGSILDPKFPKQKLKPGSKIPSLRQVFELVKNAQVPRARTVRLNIEPKASPDLADKSASSSRYAILLVELIREFAFADRVIIQSFDDQVLKEIKLLEPRVTNALLISENLPLDFVGLAKRAGATIVQPNAQWITAAQIHALHLADIKVIPYTVNEKPQWKKLIEMKVDGIITDDPRALSQYLRAGETKE